MREIIIKVMGTHRKINERSLENLRPFNTLPPEEQRKIARLGGIASGAKRRYKADLRLAMIEQLAGMQLAEETREEFRAAIQRYVREERKKRTRGNRPAG